MLTFCITSLKILCEKVVLPIHFLWYNKNMSYSKYYKTKMIVKCVKFHYSNEKDMELLNFIEESGMGFTHAVKNSLDFYFNRNTPIPNKKPERRQLNILNQLKNIRK